MTGRADVDDFLARTEQVLAEPGPAPLTACAWCAHPIDDGSPSGEFCGERCAAYWRAGSDWYPEERCVCRTCDPQGYAERAPVWIQRHDRSMAIWMEAIRAAAAPVDDWCDALAADPPRETWRRPRDVTSRGVFQLRSYATALAEVEWRLTEYQRHVAAEAWHIGTAAHRAVLGIDVTEAGAAVSVAHYDEAGNLVVRAGYSGRELADDDREPWLQDRSRDLPPAPLLPTARGQRPSMTVVDEAYRWIPAEAWAAAVEPERTPSWSGRKPNRRGRRRRGAR